MSRKDFAFLANTIRNNRKAFTAQSIMILADQLASQYSNFNKSEWLNYIDS